jgi:hypothetical protein
MALSTSYEVIVSDTKPTPAYIDRSSHGTLDSAKFGIDRFRRLYPNAPLIFARQYLRSHSSSSRFRILHNLTVHNGLTAEERRHRATSLQEIR